jgi:hypothetical protein
VRIRSRIQNHRTVPPGIPSDSAKREFALGSWIIAAALLALALPAGAFQTEWKPTPQTLKQLVDGGYEIKGFGVHSYGPRNVEGVFVLQKAGSVYQCYEFSILKDDLTTARQSLNCFELTAPYDRQPGK